MFRKTGKQQRGALAWTRIELAHLAGKAVSEIAAEEGLSRGWVRRKLRALAAEAVEVRRERIEAVRRQEAARVDALIDAGEYVKAGQLARSLTARRAVHAAGDVVIGHLGSKLDEGGDRDDEAGESSPIEIARRRVDLCRQLIRAAEARGDVEGGTWERLTAPAKGGSPL